MQRVASNTPRGKGNPLYSLLISKERITSVLNPKLPAWCLEARIRKGCALESQSGQVRPMATHPLQVSLHARWVVSFVFVLLFLSLTT